jgi:ADP-heptose:LPS heptosyltransferase
MGLGGYLTWTALAREIYNLHKIKIIPMELHGAVTKLIKSPIFYNNPHIIQEFSGEIGVQIQLNKKEANYCKVDTPEKALHKGDLHIIENLCMAYGIHKPKLKCELFLDKQEKKEVESLLKNISSDFITIEPHSNTDYTVNRSYPFEKWESVVKELSKKIQVVQIGTEKNKLLSRVVDLRGKTSFRTAGGIIEKSKFLMSTEGGLTHLATAFDTPALVILTGYQTQKMVEYHQNYYLDISSHGPCGMKILCSHCSEDSKNHNESEVTKMALDLLEKL